MDDKKRKQVTNNMLELSSTLQEELTKNNEEIVNIQYYHDFQFAGTNLGINDVYIVKIKDDSVPEKERKPREQEETFRYQIYDEDNQLIATVDKQGKITFEPKFL